jgi:hypothetical protein
MDYNNWLSSKEKWEGIVTNLELGLEYIGSYLGGIYLDGICGYCNEYRHSGFGCCSGCPLKNNELCGGENSVFDEIVDLLTDADYKSALPLAKKILDFIINDEPVKLTD